MTPTLENIAEVAKARLSAIRAQAIRLAEDYRDRGIVPAIQDDEALLDAVINKACRYAYKAGTAQAAVQWAISDLTPYEALEPTE